MEGVTESSFTDVDASGKAQSFADYLNRVSNLESVAAGKHARTMLLGLHDGSHAIDVGCGLGDDARELSRLVGPSGRMIGLDSSAELLERARERCQSGDGPIEFIVGDALKLPFEDDSFDAARTERVLQLVADPAGALAEMARVTRPGGIVLANEPDWGTLVSTGRPREFVRGMATIVESQIRNPWIGRELAGHFVDAGLIEIAIEPEVVLKRDLDVEAVIDIPSLTASMGDEERRAVDQFIAAAEADTRAGRTVCALTLFTVHGRVPEASS